MSSFQQINNLANKVLGLNEKQSLVYSICAKEGFLNPSQISRLVNIKRTTVYLELEELKRKGLVIEKMKGKRRLVGIAEPQALRELISEEKGRLKEKENLIESMISLVENLKNDTNKNTDIELLEGTQGVVILLEKILKQKQDGYWFGSIDTMLRIMPEEKLYKLFSWRRMDQKTTSYAITDRSVLEHKKLTENMGDFRKFRFLEEKVSAHAILVMFGNTIGLIRVDGKDIKIVLIKDTCMQSLLQIIFNLLWKLLPSS